MKYGMLRKRRPLLHAAAQALLDAALARRAAVDIARRTLVGCLIVVHERQRAARADAQDVFGAPALPGRAQCRLHASQC
jgi:hypothetical protein